MNSLQAIFRCMLAVWLILVAALGFAVSRSTSASYLGNTMAFLFSRADEREAPLPPESRPLPPEAPPSQPEPPEWTALPVGRTAGSGTFGAPEINVLPDGSVEIVLPLTGSPGSVSYYNPTNVSAATADFIGKWLKPPYIKQSVRSGCLSLVQTAGHEGYLRVSGVAAKGVGRLEAKAEHSPKNNAVRVVFAPAGSGKD